MNDLWLKANEPEIKRQLYIRSKIFFSRSVESYMKMDSTMITIKDSPQMIKYKSNLLAEPMVIS